MALSNLQRQRKWLDNHRALHNLRQRQYRKRKKNLSAVLVLAESHVGEAERRDSLTGDRVQNDAAREEQPAKTPDSVQDSRSGAQSFSTKKVGELRMLVLPKEEQTPERPVEKPKFFRDDFGRPPNH